MLGETLVTKSRLVIALRLFRREISASFWDQSQSEGSETVTILDFFTWKQKSKLLNFIWGKMYWINDSSLSLSAMQKKVVMNEVRTPTSHWSGLGFSKSMPESAIKELVSNSTYTDSINLFSFENELGYFDQYSLLLFTVVRWSRNIEFRAFTAPTLIQIFLVSRRSVPFARVEVKFRACNRFHACFILE